MMDDGVSRVALVAVAAGARHSAAGDRAHLAPKLAAILSIIETYYASASPPDPISLKCYPDWPTCQLAAEHTYPFRLEKSSLNARISHARNIASSAR